MRVVLDTNALMLPFQVRLNLDSEIQGILGDAEIYVPSSVMGELERLSKRRWEAKAALQLAQKYRRVQVTSLGDNGVLEAAKKLNAWVVTNDEEFISRLRREGVPVIYLRQNHLRAYDD